jgi:hypothetical protein
MTFDPEAALRREGDTATTGAVLAPAVRRYIAEGRFPRNTKIVLPGGDPNREPDDWFHPSTHPTMTARQLYYYLMEPKLWEPEPWGYEGRMSVTVGTLEHAIVRMALEDLGFWQRPKGTCPCCQRPYGQGEGECDEPGVADPVLRRRGHMDGVILTPQLGMTGYDLKTINHFAVGKIPDDPAGLPAIEWLKTKHPYYYGQMQDYMALSGLRKVVMLFIGMGLPWHLKEIHVDYDPAYVIALEAKYRLVRQCVEAGEPPQELCCPPFSKEAAACPATSCMIKKM